MRKIPKQTRQTNKKTKIPQTTTKQNSKTPPKIKDLVEEETPAFL